MPCWKSSSGLLVAAKICSTTPAAAPVIKLVNLMLFEAVKANASDVHVQPYEDRLIVRMRIDGVLYDSFTLPKRVQEEVISRVKVMGRMNIAEKRLPQDGRATVQIGRAHDRPAHRERCRRASASASSSACSTRARGCIDLTELGMDPRALARFRAAHHGRARPDPRHRPDRQRQDARRSTPRCKQINSKEKNILTLEDPIEYQLDGISQTQVSDKKGMTFASGLRSVLRQDPDVIMVGEIRDRETATMAIQSSLTGHLVFSTLHTNDAASAVTRLLDLGIEPYLVAQLGGRRARAAAGAPRVRRAAPLRTRPTSVGT